MFNQLKTIFDFNRGERIGIIVLILILIGVIIFPYLVKESRKNNQDEFVKFVKDVELFEKSLRLINDSIDEARQLNFQQMDKSIAENKLTPFPFNPNKLPSELWSKMGLKDWQIRVIKNFESKGGHFYNKEDLKKIVSISRSEYSILEPFIIISESKPEFTNHTKVISPKKERVLVELNTADSLNLISLYGIGPAFAKRIIKYRTLLGGFYSTSQLLEVYGFDQDKLDKIDDYIEVNPNMLLKININKVSTDILKKHPYFDYYTAKAIVDQRIILGKYSSMDQIKQIPLIHDELFKKIRNYITIE